MVGKDFEVGGKEREREYVVMVVKSRREKESGNGKKTWLIQEEMRIQSQFLTRTIGFDRGSAHNPKVRPGCLLFLFTTHVRTPLGSHTLHDTEYGTLAE